MMTQRVAASLLAVSISLAAAALAQPASAQENVLRVGINANDIANLDPHRATSTGDKTLVGWMFNGLVRFPPGSANPADIGPDLAESWTTSTDGREWTFKLRKGVKFHGDFGELTAEDVVYSLERAADPKRSSFSASYAGMKFKAVDDLTVLITLPHPVPGFLGLVANYHGGNIVSKKAVEKLGAEFNARPVGTGPFTVAERVTQQHVRLAAHKDYFRGTPKLSGIMYRMIPSDSSRELAFRSGELDLIYGKREQRWVEATRKADGVTVDIFSPGEFRTLYLNKTIKPLDDIRVRRAIAHAINNDDIVRFVGKDVGVKGCSIIPPDTFGEKCNWEIKFDPAKAKALLAEAGLAKGLTIKAVVSSNASQLPIMEIVQAQLAEVGIKLEMSVVDHPTYHEQIRKDLSAIVFYGAARFPIADSYLTEFYHSDASVGKAAGNTNFAHCDAADAEIKAAREAPNDEKRLQLWGEAQRKIHEAVCAVPLFSLQQVWARSNKLDYGYVLKGGMNLAPAITEATIVKR